MPEHREAIPAPKTEFAVTAHQSFMARKSREVVVSVEHLLGAGFVILGPIFVLSGIGDMLTNGNISATLKTMDPTLTPEAIRWTIQHLAVMPDLLRVSSGTSIWFFGQNLRRIKRTRYIK